MILQLIPQAKTDPAEQVSETEVLTNMTAQRDKVKIPEEVWVSATL